MADDNTRKASDKVVELLPQRRKNKKGGAIARPEQIEKALTTLAQHINRAVAEINRPQEEIEIKIKLPRYEFGSDEE